MTTAVRSKRSAQPRLNGLALTRGIVWGLIGGLLGTIIIDLVRMATSSAVGLPTVISFETIGDTAAGFFSLFGIRLVGGFPLGALMHYLCGLVLGSIFGAAVCRFDALRLDTVKKGALLGILYIEIVSQPLLATSPFILRMTASETVLWYGVSAAMHFIWGLVLGVVVSLAVRPAPEAPATS